MKTCVLDIETIPCAPAMERAHVDADAGFPPWILHELVCASILTIEHDGISKPTFRIQTFSRMDLGERGIVASAERALMSAFEVVTFNGRGFDLPVLLARAAVCGEMAPTIARLNSSNRYMHGVHVDLLDEITGRGAAPRIRLLDLCAAFSIPVKFSCAGGDVAGMVQRGEWRKISDYCEADVVATWLALQAWRSAERADPRLYADSASQLTRWIIGEPDRLAHLSPFSEMPDFFFAGPPLGGASMEKVGA
jgi:predicted PolB exonuclease-like 3'-5' exonuclease